MVADPRRSSGRPGAGDRAPMFTNLVRSRVLIAVCWLLSLPQQWRDIVDIRIFGRHRRYSVAKNADRLSPHVAIVATWARHPLRHSVQRLIDALEAQGWSVVLVANESPDTDRVIDRWSVSADVVIRRANIGRDFGAYQCGYRYIRERPDFARVERLAFFNDSVFYPPTFGSILPELLKKETAIAGFYVNHQFPRHVQSFSMMIGAPAASSLEVDEFWKTYYPSGVRRYSIRHGEVELTRRIVRRWPEVEAVVDYERLLRQDPDLWSKLTVAEEQTLRAVVAGVPRHDLDWRRKSKDRSVENDVLVREALATRNSSHALGPLAARLLGAPLKLDVLRRGVLTPADLGDLVAAMQVDEREREELLAMMTAGGTAASLSMMSTLMLETGFG